MYIYICSGKYGFNQEALVVLWLADKTSRSNTAPGSDGMPTRVLQLCEIE